MRNWLIYVVLGLASMTCAQTTIKNESARGKQFKFTSDNVTDSQVCSGGPPYYCARTDTIRHAVAPPLALTGLLGAGVCITDPELGEQICRVTDAATSGNKGFRTQSDSNSGTMSYDGKLFSFVDTNGQSYIESVDTSTNPPTFHPRGRVNACAGGEAISFSHQLPNAFFGTGFGGIGTVAISRCVLNQADSHYLTAGPTTDLSGTPAVTANLAFLDPSLPNCLGNSGYYFPYLSPSDIYNADPNDRFFSMQLRGAQDEGFLMVEFDTTLPGCHWINTRTMTEGGAWGYNSTRAGDLGNHLGGGPITNQSIFLLPVPPAPTLTAVHFAGGSLVPGSTYSACVSLTINNVGETPCSSLTPITLPTGSVCSAAACNAFSVAAPDTNPINHVPQGTGYNTYACLGTSCTPTMQLDAGAPNVMTPPTFTIACTAGCTGTNKYDYEIRLWSVADATTTVPGHTSYPTAPFEICSTARAGCNIVGTFGVNPKWTFTFTPPTGATDIVVNRSCTTPGVFYCSTPGNYLFDQDLDIDLVKTPCTAPPCTVVVNLGGSNGDHTKWYEGDGIALNLITIPNAIVASIAATATPSQTVNATGTKIHDHRGSPDGGWGSSGFIQGGNYNAQLVGGNGQVLLHHFSTGFSVIQTTTKGGAVGNPFFVINAAQGHKVLGYNIACAQDTLLDGLMTDCWPLFDSASGMEAGLRHLNPFFTTAPADSGAHHLSVQGMAPYPGVFNPFYPITEGITGFGTVAFPTSPLVGEIYAVNGSLPGYHPISGANVGQDNNPNPQYRLCSNYNAAVAGDGAGLFNSEVSGNYAPNGLSGIFTSDMGMGSPTAPPTGGPQLGDVNGVFPAVCGAGSKSNLCVNARTDIFWCRFL